MSTIQVQIPDSLQKSLDDLAARDGISIDQFISTAIAEKLSALMTENYLIERSKKGSREKYQAILTKVPDVEDIPIKFVYFSKGLDEQKWLASLLSSEKLSMIAKVKNR